MGNASCSSASLPGTIFNGVAKRSNKLSTNKNEIIR